MGAAIGLALHGRRPIVELATPGHARAALEHLASTGTRLVGAGGLDVPLVLRVPSGRSRSLGAAEIAWPERWLTRVPGLRVYCAGTVSDAGTLLRAAVREPGISVVLEPADAYDERARQTDDEAFDEPHARVRWAGQDVTLVTWGAGVGAAIEAARAAVDTGCSVEVLDLRILRPLDLASLRNAVGRTRSLLIVDEADGFGDDVLAALVEEGLRGACTPPCQVSRLDGGPSDLVERTLATLRIHHAHRA